MSASASDSDGSIARVEFWLDGAKISQDTVAPYQQNWTSTAGAHAVMARAVDNDGAIENSAVHSITVTAPGGGGGGTGSAASETRELFYDSHQRLCKIVEPETGATLMGYDAAGNVAWSASGLPANTACSETGNTAAILARRVVRSYDARNRVSTMSFPDGNGDQVWDYWANGLTKQITTLNAGTQAINAYTWNKRGLLLAESISQPGWYTWTQGYQ